VVQNEGIIRGLYKGVEASALRELSYTTIRFGLYEPIKLALVDKDQETTPVL